MGVGDSHPPPHLCRDRDCDRYGCVAYRHGYEDGRDDGFEDGFAAGMTACQHTHMEGQ